MGERSRAVWSSTNDDAWRDDVNLTHSYVHLVMFPAEDGVERCQRWVGGLKVRVISPPLRHRPFAAGAGGDMCFGNAE